MPVEHKNSSDDRKKWLIGVVCLAVVVLSVVSIVRQLPPRFQGGRPTRGMGFPGGGGPGGPQLPGTRGQIATVSAASVTIQSRRSGTKTFALTSATKITVDQKPVTAAALQVGQRARVVSADSKTADEVVVRTRPPGGFGGVRGGYPGGGYPGGGAPAAPAAGG